MREIRKRNVASIIHKTLGDGLDNSGVRKEQKQSFLFPPWEIFSRVPFTKMETHMEKEPPKDGEKSHLIVRYFFLNLRAGFLHGMGSGNTKNRWLVESTTNRQERPAGT